MASTSSPRVQLNRIILLFNVLWTAIFIASFAWNLVAEKKETFDMATFVAKLRFDQDIIYRRWATGHGGVYAPVTKETPPNPYLQYIPERDITTPSGKALTLINPAYMTRQVYELGQTETGVLGHITSLKPLRPENKADEWGNLPMGRNMLDWILIHFRGFFDWAAVFLVVFLFVFIMQLLINFLKDPDRSERPDNS